MKSSVEVLNEQLKAWSVLYGRPLNEEAVAVWHKIFRNTDARVLSLALERVTATSQRMPTPGHVTAAVIEIREARAATKQATRSPYACQEKVLTNGIKVLIDPENGEHLYRAVDCPEGRDFLATLAKLSGKTPAEMAKLFEKWCNGGNEEPELQRVEMNA